MKFERITCLIWTEGENDVLLLSRCDGTCRGLCNEVGKATELEVDRHTGGVIVERAQGINMFTH